MKQENTKHNNNQHSEDFSSDFLSRIAEISNSNLPKPSNKLKNEIYNKWRKNEKSPSFINRINVRLQEFERQVMMPMLPHLSLIAGFVVFTMSWGMITAEMNQRKAEYKLEQFISYNSHQAREKNNIEVGGDNKTPKN